jgi:hypothetical protein
MKGGAGNISSLSIKQSFKSGTNLQYNWLIVVWSIITRFSFGLFSRGIDLEAKIRISSL